MAKKRKPGNKKVKVKKRPIRVEYPYLCPLCDELAYATSDRKLGPRRLPDETFSIYECASGHTFYVYEKVVTNQAWGEDRYNNDSLKKRAREWKRQLREHNYGIDDFSTI